MDKSKFYLDLSKCTEEEQKHVFSLLPPEPHRDAYNIFRSYKYLQFIPKSKFQEKEKWMVDKQAFDKVELAYPEFIKLFKGGDNDPTAQLKADNAELLEALEKATDLLEAGFPEISAVKDFQSLIQKHKQ